MRRLVRLCGWLAIPLLLGCQEAPRTDQEAKVSQETAPGGGAEGLLAKYTMVKLTTDLSGLTDRQRKMIPLLIDACREMDEAYWLQAYGDRATFLDTLSDPELRRFAEINYGPWDRLAGNEPFIPGVEARPKGANFYPHDMTVEQFESAVAAAPDGGKALKSLYTVVQRGEGGALIAVPFSEVFADNLKRAADLLRQAAELADDAGLKKYLTLRADALLSDDYQPSDLAWMDMKDNIIDVVIGPIETYEDELLGYKAAFEGFVLVKDREWSERLVRYIATLPALQAGLPVPEEYRRDIPGSNSDLNAYDVIYYAGQCNAGSKTIAINLPNDEEVQAQKGSRRLQLKNAMRAKFDKILLPIADLLIAEDQRQHITFDAFFANTMFHEVAHGLGVANTINGKGTVREALRDQASALEEGKADVLGLYMIKQLHEQGELADVDLKDNYVTQLAGLFRSIRFGASSAHGLANLSRFNFFHAAGAFSVDPQTGVYRIDFDKTEAAIDALSERILRFQGDGDYEGVTAFMKEMAQISPLLRSSLDKVAAAGIPVDIVFEQGMSELQ